jgi:sugar lactone lactonase YvrE
VQVSCIAKRAAGGFVAGTKSGFAFLDFEREAVTAIANPEPDRPGNRFNDGKCDAAGRFWAGTMDDAERDATGWLYCLDAGLLWRRADGPYVCTNGPAFAPDGRTAYHTDTMGRVVYAFDCGGDGQLSRKRAFVRFAETDGFPDGMTVDADGCVWVAHWGGARVTRFTPRGEVDVTIALPASQVTSCAFGGADLGTLFITTAAIGLNDEARSAQPLAGGLFAVRLTQRGIPAGEFAG